MAQRLPITQTGLITKERLAIVGGGAAGNHTLTGITTNDRLIQVLHANPALTEGTPNTIAWAGEDLTDEFTIDSDDTIDNTGGTATTDGFLLVRWYDDDWGNDESETIK